MIEKIRTHDGPEVVVSREGPGQVGLHVRVGVIVLRRDEAHSVSRALLVAAGEADADTPSDQVMVEVTGAGNGRVSLKVPTNQKVLMTPSDARRVAFMLDATVGAELRRP